MKGRRESKIFGVLADTKCDLEDERVVTKSEAKMGFLFFETSSKLNINLKEIFTHLVKESRKHIFPEIQEEEKIKKEMNKDSCFLF